MRIEDNAPTSLDSVVAPSSHTETIPPMRAPCSLLLEEMFDICAVKVLGDTDYWRGYPIMATSASIPLAELIAPSLFSLANFTFPESRDTDYYAAIQTEWPMLRPPVTLDVHIKETCPAPVTLTAAMLLVT